MSMETPWSHWIFDMDGTLTVAVHDFDAIRAQLGLPLGQPILETLEGLPPDQAEALHQELNRIEWELAKLAQAQEGAAQLLEQLREDGRQVGILTRNRKDIALETLEVCGLRGYFRQEHVIGRDGAPPKPSPVGIQQLLESWGAQPEDAVMIGDYKFDLMAGIYAGTAAIYADYDREGLWDELAQRTIHSLRDLMGGP